MSNQRCKRCAVEACHCKGTHESSTTCRRFVEVEPLKAPLMHIVISKHLKSFTSFMVAFNISLIDYLR